MLEKFVKILNDKLEFYKKDPFYTSAAILLQPLARIFTDKSLERGGNILGLDRYKDDNISFLLDLSWNGTQHDAQIRHLADDVMGTLTTYLKGAGELKELQYLNYAFQDQDPLGGYGPAALAKIRAASKKYDPGQVFQKLIPGGFKLAGAGRGNQYTH